MSKSKREHAQTRQTVKHPMRGCTCHECDGIRRYKREWYATHLASERQRQRDRPRRRNLVNERAYDRLRRDPGKSNQARRARYWRDPDAAREKNRQRRRSGEEARADRVLANNPGLLEKSIAMVERLYG